MTTWHKPRHTHTCCLQRAANQTPLGPELRCSSRGRVCASAGHHAPSGAPRAIGVGPPGLDVGRGLLRGSPPACGYGSSCSMCASGLRMSCNTADTCPPFAAFCKLGSVGARWRIFRDPSPFPGFSVGQPFRTGRGLLPRGSSVSTHLSCQWPAIPSSLGHRATVRSQLSRCCLSLLHEAALSSFLPPPPGARLH